ncbi:alginate lyase family protein [Microbacterium cremeum]|uniref:alginate lyase family protein n=1 Tax=Microbacterium cremeum TaxID=2782169 RepID=UPI001886ADFC|nr:alginate lyase family protein [Microbacterium cremeum]
MTKTRWPSSIAAGLVLALVGLAPPAVAETTGDTTFRDDFDTLSRAWAQAAGSWEASGGTARVVTPGSTRGSVLALLDYGLEPTSSATATFRTEGGGETAWAGFTVHRAGPTDDYTQSGYTILVRNNGELAVIEAAGNAAVTYHARTATDARPGANWVTVTARLDGPQLSVTLGDAAAPALTVADGTFTSGGFSLAAHRDLRMVVDSVELTGVSERTEPAPADCIAWSGEPAASSARGTVLNDEERLDTVAERVRDGVEPQVSAFPRLIDDADAGLQRQPAPPERFFVPFFYNNPTAHRAARDGLQNDANTAYQLALAYRLTGDTAYGAHAAAFLDAWTGTVECVRTSEDSALAFSYHFPAFVLAAELLRGTDAWPAEREAAFAGFLRETALPVADSIMHRDNNWGSWALELTTAGVAYLGDAAGLQAAHERAVELVEHQIDANGHMPEEVTRNNGVGDYGIWYTHFSLLPLMLVAETLDLHGYDLHSYVNANGTGLGDAVEQVSGWVADPESFPYYTGDVAKLANVRTIDYLRATGVIAHSMSYFELAQNRYPSEVLEGLLADEGAMTTIHSAPHLSLTHGGIVETAHPGTPGPGVPSWAGGPGRPEWAGGPGAPAWAGGPGGPQWSGAPGGPGHAVVLPR